MTKAIVGANGRPGHGSLVCTCSPGGTGTSTGVSIGRVTAPASIGVPHSGLPEEPWVAAEQRLRAQTQPDCPTPLHLAV